MAILGMNAATRGDYLNDPRLALAMELRKAGSSTTPVHTPMEGLARALQGVVGGYSDYLTREDYKQKGNDLTSALSTAMQNKAVTQGVKPFVNPDTGETLVPAVEPGHAGLAAALKSTPQYADNQYIQDAAQGYEQKAMDDKVKLQNKVLETQTLFPYELAKAEAMGGIKAQQPPSGYRNTGDGRLAPIPGGPADPTAKPVKPMPATALKMQNEDLDAIGTVSAINADLGAFKGQLENGKLDLGLFTNMLNSGRNMVGRSTEESRNYASFKSTLNKLRNDSLRLNKGVQTEGDAVRAWDELIANINDPKVVTQRIDEITKINERAADLRKLNVDNTRANYGLDNYDFSKYENQEPAINSGAESPKVGEVQDGYEYLGGDPSNPQSWRQK